MGRACVLAFFCVLATCLSALPAFAAPPGVDPGTPCILTSAVPLDPAALLASPERFDCSVSQAHFDKPNVWGLIRNVALINDPADPWEVRHDYSQAATETLYVLYADGRIVKAPSDRRSARRMFSPGMMSFALPSERGTITAILIHVEGLENQRGIGPELELKTGRAALQGDLVVLLLYGILGGAVGSLLIYNFSLYVALRYPFILCYCLSAVSMIGMGLCWSGGIFLILPNLDTTDQISLTMLGTSTVLATSVLFLGHFIERPSIPRLPLRLTQLSAIVGLASCMVRLIDHSLAWMLIDRITYWSIIGILVGLIVTAALAWRRGSRSARVYIIAWSVPILLGIGRAVWAMGVIEGGSTIVAMSPLFFLALEAMMSALAVSWRVGGIRSERDEARAMQDHLRHVADIDVLTGLLNRRAFIERALGERPRNGRERLIVIDIDRFKLINDRHGHQAGDDVLSCVAAAIRATVPWNAIIGRLGGEEFAVVVAAEPVNALPERLCRAVEKAATPEGLSVTISVGVADGLMIDDASWRLTYYAADQALYRSKNGGRNRVSHAPRSLAA